MGQDEHAIDADGLRLVGNYVEAPKMTVVNAYGNLCNTLDSLGEPWGDDEIGQQFAAKYLPARDKTFKALGDINDGFYTVQHDLYRTADNYEATENENAK